MTHAFPHKKGNFRVFLRISLKSYWFFSNSKMSACKVTSSGK